MWLTYVLWKPHLTLRASCEISIANRSPRTCSASRRRRYGSISLFSVSVMPARFAHRHLFVYLLNVYCIYIYCIYIYFLYIYCTNIYCVNIYNASHRAPRTRVPRRPHCDGGRETHGRKPVREIVLAEVELASDDREAAHHERHVRSRATVSPEQNALFAKYPLFFRAATARDLQPRNIKNFGIQRGAGWYPLIEEAASSIAQEVRDTSRTELTQGASIAALEHAVDGANRKGVSSASALHGHQGGRWCLGNRDGAGFLFHPSNVEAHCRHHQCDEEEVTLNLREFRCAWRNAPTLLAPGLLRGLYFADWTT